METTPTTPTVSWCANCASVQKLLRTYWWDLLDAQCGTCAGCRSDIVVRTEAA